MIDVYKHRSRLLREFKDMQPKTTLIQKISPEELLARMEEAANDENELKVVVRDIEKTIKGLRHEREDALEKAYGVCGMLASLRSEFGL